MGHKHHCKKKEKEKGAHNIAQVCNSGNSTNNLNINSVSNAKVFSSAEAEVEQEEEGEDIF